MAAGPKAEHSMILNPCRGGVAIGPPVVSGEIRSTVDVHIRSGHVAIHAGAEECDDGPDFWGTSGPPEIGGVTKILRNNPHRVGEAGAVHATLRRKRSQVALHAF